MLLKRFLPAICLITAALSMPAHACQLVCIVIPDANPYGATDAKCNAAKSGFKAARAGMLSSLPNLSNEFFQTTTGDGAQNGIKCNEAPNKTFAATYFLNNGSGGSVTGFVDNASAFCSHIAATTGGIKTIVCCNM